MYVCKYVPRLYVVSKPRVVGVASVTQFMADIAASLTLCLLLVTCLCVFFFRYGEVQKVISQRSCNFLCKIIGGVFTLRWVFIQKQKYS